VTLAAGHGTIALENSSGLTSVVNPGTGSVELFGSQAAINTALTDGVVYNPTSGYTGSDALTVTVNDEGHNGTGNALSATQSVGITVTAADTIAHGATDTISAPSADTVAFADGTGTLDLTQPSTFTGEIAGIVGTGDVLDLNGFAAATTHASTGSGSYNATFNTTTLTVSDSADSLTETFKLAGDLSGSGWTVTSDGHGGVNVVDPPVVTPATVNTVVASAPDQTLTGTGSSNNFVFNFANTGHDTVTDFHAAADSLQFNSSLFANAQAALNATVDDGHGNTVVTLDASDTITLTGVLKAQLHVTDFHVV
jgi:hypothetical protein